MKNMKVESAARGTKMRQDYGMDKSDNKGMNMQEAREGRPMGGGMKNLSHSIPGKSSK